MIAKYIAYDGRTFLNAQECLDYEDSLGFVLMDENGDGVSCIDDAIAVYLVHGSVKFREMLTEQNDVDDPCFSEILECSQTGLYIWDDWTERFVYVDPDRFLGYKMILEKLYPSV